MLPIISILWDQGDDLILLFETLCLSYPLDPS